jgi:ribosomal protein S18 acetylase RimI-like enzyme
MHVVKEFIRKAEAEKLPLRLQTLLLNEKAKAFYERLGFKTLDQISDTLATRIHLGS